MSRKILVLFFSMIIVMSFIQATPYVTQWVSSKDCPNECIEGRYITFDIGIKNYGSSSFTIKYIEIRDRSNKVFAWESTNKALAPNEQTIITNVDGWLPPPTSSSTLYYKICVYTKEEHWYGSTYDWDCSSEKDMQVTPAGDIDCDYDWECSENQQCTNHKCNTLIPGECQYVENHQIKSYECCSDSDCLSDEICEGHICQSIWCSCGYIENHECIKYECCQDFDCPENHYCSNHKCITYECTQDSDCNDDQYCSYNKECLTVNWCDPTTQYVENHKCNDYECTNNWNCNYDEYCSDHKCTKLECNFGYPSNHSCSSYWPATITIILIIAGIIIIRYYRKKVKHKKKK